MSLCSAGTQLLSHSLGDNMVRRGRQAGAPSFLWPKGRVKMLFRKMLPWKVGHDSSGLAAYTANPGAH